jgi:pimeloyl-ACP methyl ester carboxylesterase
MERFRTYGDPPFSVAVVHGGPGAPGEVAGLAQRLAGPLGVIEPFQSRVSVGGQVKELADILTDAADPPVKLVGWSWGAWLGFLLAARVPELVSKLVLVGSGPFEEGYALGITGTRMRRLSVEDRESLVQLLDRLQEPTNSDDLELLSDLDEMMAKTDSLDPLPHAVDTIEYQYRVHRDVWAEASEMRRNGRLLEEGRDIVCPVVAVHGDHDPHPIEGVEAPLLRVLADFRMIVIPECGHKPWIERSARETFLEVLRGELED